MSKPSSHAGRADDAWTLAHDLALIYVALAYGADHRLSDEELETITTALQGWQQELRRDEVHEVVLEAITIFLEEHAEQEVVRSVQSLRQTLSREERSRVLEEIMRIAEADGVVLSSERNLISVMAEIWELKAAGQNLRARTTAAIEHLSWSLMHDIGLVFLVMAHSTDNDLSTEEIKAIVLRLQEWQSALTEDEVRAVLREALAFYATGPSEEALRRSVQAIRDTLPMMLRLALLDDLCYIARSDGVLNQEEKAMIDSLAQAWNINVRLNGQGHA